MDNRSIGTLTMVGILEGARSRALVAPQVMQLASNASLVGKTCLVTGANRGLGRAIAVHLAALGANVIVACRHSDPAIAEGILADAAASPLRDAANNASDTPVAQPSVTLVHLDLSDLSSVQTCADALTAQGAPHLDIIITNAAVVPARDSVTQDGFELMFQVNYLGHALLLRRLVPLGDASSALVAGIAPPPPHVTPPQRVVMVASEAHRTAELLADGDLGKWEPYGPTTSMRQYAHTKLALTTFAQELRRRVGPATLVTSICPGPVNSHIARHSPALVRPLVSAFMNALFASPSQAAEAVVLAAGSQRVASGSHWHMGFEAPPRPDAVDPAAGAKLWRDTSALLGRWAADHRAPGASDGAGNA